MVLCCLVLGGYTNRARGDDLLPCHYPNMLGSYDAREIRSVSLCRSSGSPFYEAEVFLRFFKDSRCTPKVHRTP